MQRKFFRRPSPALVISCVALFVALGGVGYAAATITSGDIKNNTIRSRDVRNGALLGRDLKRGTIGGREVKESKLGTVRAALGAGSVDGHSFARIDYRVPAGTPTRAIFNGGGLILNATCTGAGDLNFTATTNQNNAMVHVGTIHDGNAVKYADNDDLDTGENVNAVPAKDNHLKGSLTYVSPAGAIVDVSYLAEERTNGLASGNDCFVVGSASITPG